jgi:phage N-6-adenine-methyltransferase
MILIKYDTARQALAEAHQIDEIKDIRDQAMAMRLYAQQAKDTELIGFATEIRLRAERRAGELLIQMAESDERPLGRKKESHSATLSDLGVTKTQSSRWQALAKVPQERFEAKVATAKRRAEDSTTSAPRDSRSEFTGEIEWYTPGEYVALAREVMGSIDLDPATSEMAQRTVKAGRFFTVADDGLAQRWSGKVWLNPPYAQPAIAHFVEKLVHEVEFGDVHEAVMLTNSSTDTAWFHHAVTAASALCFTRGRIRFVDPQDDRTAPTTGQVFFYYGANPERFEAVFSRMGLVLPVPTRRAMAVAA